MFVKLVLILLEFQLEVDCPLILVLKEEIVVDYPQVGTQVISALG